MNEQTRQGLIKRLGQMTKAKIINEYMTLQDVADRLAERVDNLKPDAADAALRKINAEVADQNLDLNAQVDKLTAENTRLQHTVGNMVQLLAGMEKEVQRLTRWDMTIVHMEQERSECRDRVSRHLSAMKGLQ